MKKIAYSSSGFIFFLFVNIGLSLGQGEAKITSGIVSLQSGDYEKAVASLEDGLKFPELLKPESLAKGYHYLGEAYVMVWQRSLLENDPAWLKKYPEPGLLAYHNFRSSMEADDTGKWEDKNRSQISDLEPMLTQTGLTYVNMGTSGGNLTESQRHVVLTLAFDYFEVLSEISPDSYLNYDFMGQIRLAQKDSVGALRDFLTAIELHKQYPPEMPDLLIGYLYYRASLLHRYLKKDKKRALADLQTGLAVLDQEYQKLQKYTSAGMDNLRVQRMDQQYKNASTDLRMMELDIYLQSPELAEEGARKFEAAVRAEPANYNLRVAYASLLESVDVNKSIAQYEAAAAIDPRQETALYNLGALYVNQGVALQRQAMESADSQEVIDLTGKSNQFFRKALPWLEKAYASNPGSRNAVQAIMQIATQLEEVDLYNKYKDIYSRMSQN
ncbi:MAG: tetratricopeptide repeat protein [Bacteroidia bacterium]